MMKTYTVKFISKLLDIDDMEEDPDFYETHRQELEDDEYSDDDLDEDQSEGVYPSDLQ